MILLDKLIVSPSPHQKKPITTTKVMFMVILSLVPAVISATVIFGAKALLLVANCIAWCLIFELLSRKIMKRSNTITDLSAVVTGILLALNFPVTLPLWMSIIGSFVAIVIVKQLFGGLGQNFANPAIVGRIVLMLSFTSEMTTWVKPFWYKTADLTTSATPLAMEWTTVYESTSGFLPATEPPVAYLDLFLGNVGGCIGETSALALLIGGLFLLIARIITPAIPLTFIGTVALLTAVTGGDPLYAVLSGGLLLGAFFMATDYVTSPITTKGKIVFGIGCGLITFLIREFGSYPEGVSFSILLMNILTPYIDKLTRTKPLGALAPVKEKKEAKSNG